MPMSGRVRVLRGSFPRGAWSIVPPYRSHPAECSALLTDEGTGDVSGDTFFMCYDGPVLYAGSENAARIVSANLDAVVRLVVGVPTWQDFVPNALDLNPMRDSFESFYAEMQDYEPQIAEQVTD